MTAEYDAYKNAREATDKAFHAANDRAIRVEVLERQLNEARADIETKDKLIALMNKALAEEHKARMNPLKQPSDDFSTGIFKAAYEGLKSYDIGFTDGQKSGIAAAITRAFEKAFGRTG